MKNQIKCLIFLLFVVVIINFVSATEVFRQNEEVNLIKSVRVNGGLSTDLLCNITVTNPNGLVIVEFSEMTNQTSFHNFTFPINNITELGIYDYDIYCTDGNLNATNSYQFDVTPSGKRFETSDAIIFAIIIVSMFLVSLFFLYMARQTESDGIKLFFMLLSFVMVILTAGTGRVLIDYLPISGGINGLVTSFLFILGIVFVLIMYYVMINQTRRSLELMRAKKGFEGATDWENF